MSSLCGLSCVLGVDCSDWFGGSCFIFQDFMTWREAISSCQRHGFHLALMENAEMNEAVKNMRRKISLQPTRRLLLSIVDCIC